MAESNSLKIVVDVIATLNLQHTNIPSSEHSIEKVRGIIKTYDDGYSTIQLETLSGNKFSNMSGLSCIISVVIDILTGKKKKKQNSNNTPKNLLELSPNGYRANWRLYFGDENNYGEKTSLLEFVEEKDGVRYYTATVETLHHYPKSLSGNLVRILPNDVFVFNAERSGKLYGKTIIHWLKRDESIYSIPAEVEITLEDVARLDKPQIFSYSYQHDQTDVLPFNLQIKGDVFLLEE